MGLEPKRIIEAAFFMSTTSLTPEELARIAGLGAVGFAEEQVRQLQKEYEERGSAIIIACENGAYLMRVRDDYTKQVAGLAKEAEISKGALRILALVAHNQSIQQSKLVKMMGSTVYDAVKELKEKGFVESQKSGRTKLLKTTPKFSEYFQK
ncbi:MAG: SMC-Scp complex subunit ScpB [Candidatus Micrarchaeota archaeon]